MNRRKFTRIIGCGILAPLVALPSAKANQGKRQLETPRDAETLAELKGFDRGYYGCLQEIRRQTKFSPKKCYEYDGVMYIAGVRGRIL